MTSFGITNSLREKCICYFGAFSVYQETVQNDEYLMSKKQIKKLSEWRRKWFYHGPFCVHINDFIFFDEFTISLKVFYERIIFIVMTAMTFLTKFIFSHFTSGHMHAVNFSPYHGKYFDIPFTIRLILYMRKVNLEVLAICSAFGHVNIFACFIYV